MAHPSWRRALGLWVLTALLAGCGARMAAPPARSATPAPGSASPTVAEAAKLPQDQQEQLIRGIVDRAVTNLTSPTGVDGKPKNAVNLQQQRLLASLTRALFIPDTRPDALPIHGPPVVVARIRKYSTQTPDRTVLDVMGELVDWSFQHFYTENEDLTAEARAKFDARSDRDQELWFRILIQNYENKRDNDRGIAALKAKDWRTPMRVRT